MSILKSYLTCNFDDAEAVDIYYLEISRFDNVIWAGVYSTGKLTEDYMFVDDSIIGDIIAALRDGNDEPLTNLIDDTIYGEWLTVYDASLDQAAKMAINVMAHPFHSLDPFHDMPPLEEVTPADRLLLSDISDIDDFLHDA